MSQDFWGGADCGYPFGLSVEVLEELGDPRVLGERENARSAGKEEEVECARIDLVKGLVGLKADPVSAFDHGFSGNARRDDFDTSPTQDVDGSEGFHLFYTIKYDDQCAFCLPGFVGVRFHSSLCLA